MRDAGGLSGIGKLKVERFVGKASVRTRTFFANIASEKPDALFTASGSSAPFPQHPSNRN